MSVPGRNLLGMAMGLIQPQTVTLYRFITRVTTAAGQYVPLYAPGVQVAGGSVQPVPAARYVDLGLDRTRRHVQWWAPVAAFGVARGRAPDEFEWNGSRWQIVQETDWLAQDGWVTVVAVETDPNVRPRTLPALRVTAEAAFRVTADNILRSYAA